MLPWALLVVGSAASLAANVAVAQPTVVGRVIAAWPSFALIGAYEMLMRQVRCSAVATGKPRKPEPRTSRSEADGTSVGRPPALGVRAGGRDGGTAGLGGVSRELQQQAWQWTLTHRASDGSLPSGREIAHQHGRHERWGRLVKRSGTAGQFSDEPGEPGLRLAGRSLSLPGE